MSIQSFIAGEKDRFDEEFCGCNKCRSTDINRDSVKSFLSASHAKNLERLIGVVESEMVPNHLIYDSNACPDCAKNAVLYRLKDTLSKELEQLK